MRFRFASFVAVAASMAVASSAWAAELPAGFTQMSVPGNTASRGTPSGRLGVVVWYPAPADTPVAPIAVGPPGAPLFLEGEAAADAPLVETPQRFPLIVVSHGTGGTAMDLSWLCAGLAARGYIVAAVMHPGNNAREPQTVAGTTLWWLRADDLSRTIDGVLADSRFGTRIDAGRIGAAGFSLGGHTVLTLAGARSDPDRLDAYCARNPQTPVCSGEATPGVPNLAARARELAAADPAFRAAAKANADDHRDGRVKAVFAIAPALGPAIDRASLAGVVIPVALVAGMGDPILPVTDNIIPDALALPTAELTLLPKTVGHYTFLTDCTAAGRGALPAICTDMGPGRVAVHRATLDRAADFFARTLGR